MIARFCGVVAVLTFLATVPTGPARAAADFWEDKDFTDWSDKEVDEILTDSPWSSAVSVHSADFALNNRVGGLSGGIVGTGGGFFRGGVGLGGGGVGGDGAGNLGGGSFMAPPRRTRLVVRWVSALPVRQAVLRRANAGATTSAELRVPAPNEDAYRVAVIGIPVELPDSLGGVAELLAATSLRRGNAMPLSPRDIRLSYDDGLLSFEFQFPRVPLTLDDEEVEFITALGRVKISKTFRLRNMVVRGQLAL